MATRSKASTSRAVVGIIMGSQSDWATMQAASHMLDALKVPHETGIVSAHRTPDRMAAYAKEAEARKRGGKAVGKVAGMAAKMHMGRKPRKAGGRVGADSSPLSSAHSGTPAKGRHAVDID